ncbi:hypothetical protein E1B28_010478 [Marasmius oreades]|uniref:Uncharacterized protein n=1 Tax=Marasmius oreades TaxID=181124 RepID=A0A9P7UR64_9AGAR|nr:uncharacterized protein E1B28_010478 [Marasmius oreades]KAG7091442.1 hypothetical protein E1B28_010478 [Marasmius oreades]
MLLRLLIDIAGSEVQLVMHAQSELQCKWPAYYICNFLVLLWIGSRTLSDPDANPLAEVLVSPSMGSGICGIPGVI